MQNRKINIALLSVIGGTLVVLGASNLKSATLITQEPVAGISLTMNEYYESTSELTKASLAKIAEKAILENEATNDTKDVEKDSDEDKEEVKSAEQEKEEIEKIKAQYDNLGIAKVDNYLNIREKPGEDKKVIGKLPKNAGCNIISIDKEGWAKIKSGKITGYVMSKPYLVMGKEAEAMIPKVGTKNITVNTTTLKFRQKPSVDSITITMIGLSEEFRVLKEMDDWVKIEVDQDKGYVSKDYVTISYELKKAVSDTELEEDSANGVTSTRASMISYAKQFLGNPYVFGGNSLTGGIDCSAFVRAIYGKYGYGLSRTSGSQAGYGKSISYTQAKPGDLIFYGNNGHISHVAMSIGNGQIIHASNPSDGIKISNMTYRTPVCARRIIND